MGISDLGKRLWQVAAQHGRTFWEEIAQEATQQNPKWERLREHLHLHAYQFRRELNGELRRWLEQELRNQGIHAHTLWGRDPALERSYQQLDLPYGTPIEQVKARWRALLKEYHPDRFMSDPQAYTQATEKAQRLTAAYHTILKASQDGRI